MICCCSLAGTTACRTCARRSEFYYPQYVIEYSKTNPLILQDDSSKIAALEHAVEILNEKIDELLKLQESSRMNSTGKLINESAKVEVEGYGTCVSSDDFPNKPYEGQY